MQQRENCEIVDTMATCLYYLLFPGLKNMLEIQEVMI